MRTLRELLEREQTQRRDAESRAAELHAESGQEGGAPLAATAAAKGWRAMPLHGWGGG